MHQLFLHLQGLDNVLVDVEKLPEPTDQWVMGRNPRRRDGKSLPFLLPEVTQVYFSTSSITFIEVMPSGEEDDIETFIRE